MPDGYEVVETIDNAHPRHVDYPLLPGDLITRDDDGTFGKEAPGMCVLGFRLTDEQIARLKPVTYKAHGLDYYWEAKVDA